ncbi:MAG: RagB/SusD family nutrient uptake outer membrane protein [Bacteroidota bacterium]
MKKIIFAFIGISIFLGACNINEYLDVSPIDEYTSASVFKTEADMIIASNYLYTFLPFLDQQKSDNRMWLYTDDGWRRNGGNEKAKLNWLASDANTPHRKLHFYRYDDIRHCNELIARIPGAEFSDPDIATRVEAEARFIRAMLYERMVLLHGDIPLVTEPQDLDFFPSNEGQREVVFDFVISELEAIAQILPESYPGSDAGRVTKWAALTLKARAYLNAVGWHSNPSELYDGAEAACRQIIQGSGMSLDDGIDGFRRLFMPDSDYDGSSPSTATVLSRVYVDNLLPYEQISFKGLPRGAYFGTGEGAGNNQAQYGATWNLVQSFQTINGLAPVDDPTYDPADAFTDRDPRLRASLILPGDMLQTRDGGGSELYAYQPHPDSATVNADRGDRNTGMDTGYLIRKYVGLSLDDNITLIYINTKRGHADYKIFRYAEVLLMMAEALAADNNPEALTYVNMVRNRVGMPSYNGIGDVPTVLMNGTTGNAYIDAVLLERRYEFAGEGGHRMMDIWRYRLGDQVYGHVEGIPENSALNGDLEGPRTRYANTNRRWDDKYYLFPLPQSALDVNPNLTNNPGW